MRDNPGTRTSDVLAVIEGLESWSKVNGRRAKDVFASADNDRCNYLKTMNQFLCITFLIPFAHLRPAETGNPNQTSS